MSGAEEKKRKQFTTASGAEGGAREIYEQAKTAYPKEGKGLFTFSSDAARPEVRKFSKRGRYRIHREPRKGRMNKEVEKQKGKSDGNGQEKGSRGKRNVAFEPLPATQAGMGKKSVCFIEGVGMQGCLVKEKEQKTSKELEDQRERNKTASTIRYHMPLLNAARKGRGTPGETKKASED